MQAVADNFPIILTAMLLSLMLCWWGLSHYLIASQNTDQEDNASAESKDSERPENPQFASREAVNRQSLSRNRMAKRGGRISAELKSVAALQTQIRQKQWTAKTATSAVSTTSINTARLDIDPMQSADTSLSAKTSHAAGTQASPVSASPIDNAKPHHQNKETQGSDSSINSARGAQSDAVASVKTGSGTDSNMSNRVVNNGSSNTKAITKTTEHDANTVQQQASLSHKNSASGSATSTIASEEAVTTASIDSNIPVSDQVDQETGTDRHTAKAVQKHGMTADNPGPTVASEITGLSKAAHDANTKNDTDKKNSNPDSKKQSPAKPELEKIHHAATDSALKITSAGRNNQQGSSDSAGRKTNQTLRTTGQNAPRIAAYQTPVTSSDKVKPLNPLTEVKTELRATASINNTAAGANSATADSINEENTVDENQTVAKPTAISKSDEHSPDIKQPVPHTTSSNKSTEAFKTRGAATDNTTGHQEKTPSVFHKLPVSESSGLQSSEEQSSRLQNPGLHKKQDGEKETDTQPSDSGQTVRTAGVDRQTMNVPGGDAATERQSIAGLNSPLSGDRRDAITSQQNDQHNEQSNEHSDKRQTTSDQRNSATTATGISTGVTGFSATKKTIDSDTTPPSIPAAGLEKTSESATTSDQSAPSEPVPTKPQSTDRSAVNQQQPTGATPLSRKASTQVDRKTPQKVADTGDTSNSKAAAGAEKYQTAAKLKPLSPSHEARLQVKTPHINADKAPGSDSSKKSPGTPMLEQVSTSRESQSQTDTAGVDATPSKDKESDNAADSSNTDKAQNTAITRQKTSLHASHSLTDTTGFNTAPSQDKESGNASDNSNTDNTATNGQTSSTHTSHSQTNTTGFNTAPSQGKESGNASDGNSTNNTQNTVTSGQTSSSHTTHSQTDTTGFNTAPSQVKESGSALDRNNTDNNRNTTTNGQTSSSPTSHPQTDTTGFNTAQSQVKESGSTSDSSSTDNNQNTATNGKMSSSHASHSQPNTTGLDAAPSQNKESGNATESSNTANNRNTATNEQTSSSRESQSHPKMSDFGANLAGSPVNAENDNNNDPQNKPSNIRAGNQSGNPGAFAKTQEANDRPIQPANPTDAHAEGISAATNNTPAAFSGADDVESTLALEAKDQQIEELKARIAALETQNKDKGEAENQHADNSDYKQQLAEATEALQLSKQKVGKLQSTLQTLQSRTSHNQFVAPAKATAHNRAALSSKVRVLDIRSVSKG